MNRAFALSFSLAVAAVALPVGVAAKPSPSSIPAAVTAPGRPAEQIKLDASRKPAEVLAFSGLKRGMKVADIMAGAGYYTEIMARVVGPKGRVTAYEPVQFMPTDGQGKAIWSSLIARRPNVAQTAYIFEAFAAPANSIDFTMLHLSYHDLYWESTQYKIPRADPAAFVAALYKATKPGGIVAVIDHVGPGGDTRAVVEKLHRIDPAVVKADFVKAGFVLDGESDVLKVAADDHTKLVFDPGVRGNTDRFAFRFKKPKR